MTPDDLVEKYQSAPDPPALVGSSATDWSAVNLARELAVVADARRAVGARLGLLDPFLRDPEPHVRAMAAEAAGRFPEVVTRLLPGPEAALRGEPDEHARAALRSVVANAEPP